MANRSDACRNFNFSTACWECTKNMPGKACIEYRPFSTLIAVLWTIVGLVPAVLVAMLGRDRQLAIIRAHWAQPSMLTLVVGIALLFCAVYVIGHIIKTKRSHPHDYAVASFTAPISIYAAAAALFASFPNVP